MLFTPGEKLYCPEVMSTARVTTVTDIHRRGPEGGKWPLKDTQLRILLLLEFLQSHYAKLAFLLMHLISLTEFYSRVCSGDMTITQHHWK